MSPSPCPADKKVFTNQTKHMFQFGVLFYFRLYFLFCSVTCSLCYFYFLSLSCFFSPTLLIGIFFFLLVWDFFWLLFSLVVSPFCLNSYWIYLLHSAVKCVSLMWLCYSSFLFITKYNITEIGSRPHDEMWLWLSNSAINRLILINGITHEYCFLLTCCLSPFCPYLVVLDGATIMRIQCYSIWLRWHI